MNLCGSAFTKHAENQLKVIHMVAQVFSFKPFQLLVFAWRYAKSGFGNFSRQNLIILMVFCSAIFPFVCQFLANGNPAHALLYPVLAVSFELIEHSCPFRRQFWILYLLHSFVAHLG